MNILSALPLLRPSRRLAVATLALPPLVAASMLPAHAISDGGENNTTAKPWSARVLTPSYSCTGTLISDHWVLTAAHCVRRKDAKGAYTIPVPPREVHVVIGRDDLSSGGGADLYADRVEVYPEYTGKMVSGDIALIHLEGALPSTARPLALAPPQYTMPSGALPVIFGYGNTKQIYHNIKGDKPENWDLDDYTGTGTKYLRNSAAGAYLYNSECEDEPIAYCLQHPKAPSQIMDGDSGGPIVPRVKWAFIAATVSSSLHPIKIGPKQLNFLHHAAIKVTHPQLRSWIVSTASVITPVEGTVYSEGSTGPSWLTNASGFARKIDPAEYACVVGSRTVTRLSRFDLGMIPKEQGMARCTARAGLLAGDLDNFGYGFGGTIPNDYYDLSGPTDLGIFDRERVVGDQVDGWVHEFKLPKGFVPSKVKVQVGEVFSEGTAPMPTLQVDNTTFVFVGPGTHCESDYVCYPQVRTFTLKGSAAAAAAKDGKLVMRFQENGDNTALDYAAVQITAQDGRVIGDLPHPGYRRAAGNPAGPGTSGGVHPRSTGPDRT